MASLYCLFTLLSQYLDSFKQTGSVQRPLGREPEAPRPFWHRTVGGAGLFPKVPRDFESLRNRLSRLDGKRGCGWQSQPIDRAQCKAHRTIIIWRCTKVRDSVSRHVLSSAEKIRSPNMGEEIRAVAPTAIHRNLRPSAFAFDAGFLSTPPTIDLSPRMGVAEIIGSNRASMR